jgi:VWFA-related protein
LISEARASEIAGDFAATSRSGWGYSRYPVERVASMLRVLRSAFLLSGSLALFSAQSSGQAPQSAPQPTIATDGGGQDTYHLNASTQEVVVDVVVTDDKGRPVHGLTKNEFTLLEGTTPQQIRGFAERVGPTPEELAKVPPMPKLPKGTFTNYSPVDRDQTLNVLLVDSLNTATKDQAFVRNELKKYLNNAKPGMRVAIFGLTTHLILLQGFTADPAILRDILDKKNPVSSVLLDDPNGNGMDMPSMMGDDPEVASIMTSVSDFQAEQQSFQTQLRTTYTLDAMADLARYLSSLPGRKNLIWFSSSFPVSILPDGDLTNPFTVMGSNDDQFRQTVNMLARAQVAVYPVDAQGLAGSSVFNAAASGKGFNKNITAFGAATQNFLNQNAEAHTTMMQMAEATGGKAYLNTNGLSQAVQSAIDTGQNYYSLTYSPAGARWDGDYKKITVKLDKPYELSYRRGYYADDPEKNKRTIEEATGGQVPPSDRESLGMMRGAPAPTQITLKVMVQPSTAPPQPEVATGNAVNPCAVVETANSGGQGRPKGDKSCTDSLKIKGPFKNYEVTILANPAQISFPLTTAGQRFGALEFITYVYDKDGSLILLKDDHTHSTLTPEAYAKFVHGSGVRWKQEISVPEKGEYYLRIGIHDMLSDKMGGVEIPVSSVAKLDPVAPPAAAPANK